MNSDLNEKAKMIKILGENQVENVSDLHLGKDLLGHTHKKKWTIKIFDTLDLKNSAHQKFK